MFGSTSKVAPAYGADGETPPQFRPSSDDSVSGPGGKRNKSLAAIFVRHGETNANNANKDIVRGTLDNADTQLNAAGKEQAADAGRTLARHGGVATVFHSPLGRGTDTAKAIVNATGAKRVESKGLMPWNKGDAQGKPAAKEDPKLRNYALHRRNTKVPGGEAFGTFAKRTDTEARRIVSAGRRSVSAGKGPVAAVTHSVDDRRLRHAIEGTPEPEPLRGGLKPGEMAGVTVDSKVKRLKPGAWGTR